MEQENGAAAAPFDQEVTDALERLPALVQWLADDLELLEDEDDWTEVILGYHSAIGVVWTEPYAVMSGGSVDLLLIYPPRDENDNKQRTPCRQFLFDDNLLLPLFQDQMGAKISVSMRDAHTNAAEITTLTECPECIECQCQDDDDSGDSDGGVTTDDDCSL